MCGRVCGPSNGSDLGTFRKPQLEFLLLSPYKVRTTEVQLLTRADPRKLLVPQVLMQCLSARQPLPTQAFIQLLHWGL